MEPKPTFSFIQVNIKLNIFNSGPRNEPPSDLCPRIDNQYHAIFAFILQVLLAFLGLKNQQGRDEEPLFDTCPIIMSVAIISLLIYCVSYSIRQKISASDSFPHLYACVVYRSMAIFGLLSLASLSSLVLPQSMLPVLFMLALLLILCQYLPNLRALEEFMEKLYPRRGTVDLARIIHRQPWTGLPLS